MAVFFFLLSLLFFCCLLFLVVAVFFLLKTSYYFMTCLVGSEMCLIDISCKGRRSTATVRCSKGISARGNRTNGSLFFSSVFVVFLLFVVFGCRCFFFAEDVILFHDLSRGL